jgi:hypothetical protein
MYRQYWKAACLLLVAMLVSSPRYAAAHGGLSMDQDFCKLRIGPYAMHFTGYQPESTGTKEFCEDIPQLGATVVALDAIDQPLRDFPLEVRIIYDTGDEHDLDAITVLRLPPKAYPTGSVSFSYNFLKAGKYVGLVSVKDNNQIYISRFPFSVAKGWSGMRVYFLILAVILAGAILYWYSVTFAGGRTSTRSSKSS